MADSGSYLGNDARDALICFPLCLADKVRSNKLIYIGVNLLILFIYVSITKGSLCKIVGSLPAGGLHF